MMALNNTSLKRFLTGRGQRGIPIMSGAERSHFTIGRFAAVSRRT
jgi:hypothetical protein